MGKYSELNGKKKKSESKFLSILVGMEASRAVVKIIVSGIRPLVLGPY